MKKRTLLIICVVALAVLASACNSFSPPLPTFNADANATLPPPTEEPTEEPTQTPEVQFTPEVVETPTPEPVDTADPEATTDPNATADPSASPTPTSTPEKTYVWVKGEGVNLREKASTDSEKLTSYKKGTKLELLEKGDNWDKVTDGTKTGYIRNDYLSSTEVK